MGVPALRVRHGEQAHELRKLAILARPQDNVPMVGHQTIAEHADGQALIDLIEPPLEAEVILVLEEHPIPRHGPVEHMIRKPARIDASSPGHGGECHAWTAICQPKTPDP